MDMLRFITAGSVDDGKSTLIGRLLYDTNSVFADQLESLGGQDGEDINLAHLTDGLKAEREQGITIDVAYKYFSTDVRKFIIADAPGHVQYTRNMVTGASNADLIIVLVDARKGVIEQTRRHTLLAALLKIPRLLLAVNKMDLVDFDKNVFDKILTDFNQFAGSLGFQRIDAVPVSALKGDNIVQRSHFMDWYAGPSLLETLETVPAEEDSYGSARIPVQYVIRNEPEYRGYTGRLSGGVLHKGDKITVFPSGLQTTIEHIDFNGQDWDEAVPGMSLSLRLKEDLDISRGDLIAGPGPTPKIGTSFTAAVCWMDPSPLYETNRFILRQGTNSVRAEVIRIETKLDISTATRTNPGGSLNLNDIGLIHVRTAKPIAWDDYAKNTHTGSFLLIEENSNQTVAAGMIGNLPV
ncbi:sulfate adenylyltransferase subunit 1 [Leptospira sp. GIMC2001]|uniref:sulfate adenylyltransferase subunit 1 n=1 Tax=Leptospira sp. GIMC2001 TaxID=1513297 RepID=UPI0023494ADF|nr:GTP-binding protein [Leptospira sp. GIMC2001]WCL51332.1 GTP-binding protein [Leptospira sp. GIMC2001]